ncbi:hypothetical protein [Flavobacterium sp. NKUCC04_CG]|uniref:hypothetical protein n=1 Tax=Flavobacterium sp. NKUCC04_CG TaxID=2842121 RepID=UPI001C5B8162|nr:hypothetical protein [Flavobacterium sp. NKUCC04_CG]MBW3518083.1 hypothetical protein [Flavobacterium sp. NKUCC04_CG]
MNKIIRFLIIFTTISNLNAQHLYKEKFDNCIIEAFCLDCGTTKAAPPSTINEEIESMLNKSQFQKAVGIIRAQVLIYDSGKACLLSVDNATNVSTKKLGLQKAINNLSNWTPAITKDKKETSSVTLILEFNRGNLQTKRWIFDAKNATNMSSTAVSKVRGTDSSRLPYTWTLYLDLIHPIQFRITLGYDQRHCR